MGSASLLTSVVVQGNHANEPLFPYYKGYEAQCRGAGLQTLSAPERANALAFCAPHDFGSAMIPPPIRKTKIIATLGPATQSAEMVASLIASGVNVFRLNMSHAPHGWCREMAAKVRAAAAASQQVVALLMDLKGPTIRTGDLSQAYELQPGDLVEFRLQNQAATLPYSTTVNYPGLYADLEVGATVLVDNGVLEMKVLSLEPARVVASVINEGTFGSRRHINLPGIKVNLPAMGDHDYADLDVAQELGVEFVAMSFVRDASHIQFLRAQLELRGMKADIVAKFEDQEALKHSVEIVAATDVVMVARGDLGIEAPLEELPITQHKLILECIRQGRRVIVATHMLESMCQNPVPTRAEVTDVAHAVLEQTDAIMLSGETSTGEHPLRAVEVMSRIAKRMELETISSAGDNMPLDDDKKRVVRSAVKLADSFASSCVLVFTQRGRMARYASLARPLRAPIFAFCADAFVVRTLALCRGVTAFDLAFSPGDAETAISDAIALLTSRGLLNGSEKLVITSDILHQGENTDVILVR
jgi:pyruvate kinase